jgi:exopolyphosphatase/guanosine-5'-triphosphate,3'-diphosphate pyrophosphatase
VNVAAVDCGTNSTRLLIADAQGRSLVREMRITRLGENVDRTGALGDAALARNFSVLEQYGAMMRDYEVTRAVLVATSAARDASNGAAFLERAGLLTGAEVTLLSGDEEAALSYYGATADLQPTPLPTMIVDIGGGSTELAALVGEHLVSHSMQMGCVRVTERALGAGVVTPDTAHAAWAMIGAELDAAFVAQPVLETLVGACRIVGLAGTVSTLAQLVAGLAAYNREAVHHRHLDLNDVVRWRVLLSEEPPIDRLRHPGMVRGREDVLVAGLFILEAVLRRFDAPLLLSSENDILDGLIMRVLGSLP